MDRYDLGTAPMLGTQMDSDNPVPHHRVCSSCHGGGFLTYMMLGGRIYGVKGCPACRGTTGQEG